MVQGGGQKFQEGTNSPSCSLLFALMGTGFLQFVNICVTVKDHNVSVLQ